jgi:hypothetical protein
MKGKQMTMNQTTIRLGVDRVSMMNPPNEGIVIDRAGDEWAIRRNSYGAIVLRFGSKCHPEFVDGMFMAEFCCWINGQFN